jgi:hypothetical protein
MPRKRERRSLIVNSIFDRSAGKLIVNADKLIFRSMRESYQDKSSKDTQNLRNAEVQEVMTMGKFHLSEQSLKVWQKESSQRKVWHGLGIFLGTRDIQKFDSMALNLKADIPLQPNCNAVPYP